jgi:hypothetical protein
MKIIGEEKRKIITDHISTELKNFFRKEKASPVRVKRGGSGVAS